MVKITLLRLPDWAGKELEKIAGKKGIPFATATKELICEHLNKNTLVEPSKAPTSAASTTE